MCALMAGSLFWLRRNLYEGFLSLHIALSVIVLVTMLLCVFTPTLFTPTQKHHCPHH